MEQPEIFICKSAHKDKIVSTADTNLWKPGFEDFVACGFTTEDFQAAKDHCDADAGGSLACWIESHPGGDRNKPAIRTIHGSDWGGVYVDEGSPSAW